MMQAFYVCLVAAGRPGRARIEPIIIGLILGLSFHVTGLFVWGNGVVAKRSLDRWLICLLVAVH